MIGADFLPAGKDWLDAVEVTATTVIAGAGLWIAFLQYKLGQRQQSLERATDQLALVSRVMNAGRIAAQADSIQLNTVQNSLDIVGVEAQQLFGMHSMTWMAIMKLKGLVEKLKRALSDPVSGIDIPETRKELRDAADEIPRAAQKETGNNAYLDLVAREYKTSKELVDMVFERFEKTTSKPT